MKIGDYVQIIGYCKIENGPIGQVAEIKPNGMILVNNFPKESGTEWVLFFQEHLRFVK